jgi:predicted DNA binding CopG/RHH family protein
MQTSNNPPRLNFNVPRSLVNEIRNIASQRGIEPSWWLRKVIEKAVSEERGNGR